jgi:glucan phosphoethanolaminetransferase (alkaline phosphatase superfamily)
VSIFSSIFHSKLFRLVGKFFKNVNWLALWVPIALIIPNVVLSCTEPVSLTSALANVLLPLGVFLMLMGCWRKTGPMSLIMIIFMFFAAFQVVLLYLYGSSVIAVDMFLNVVTTNVSEATELLANLLNAMASVVVLYLIPIIWGICATVKKQQASANFRRKLMKWGGLSTCIGAVMVVLSYVFGGSYSFVHETFPVNAISNMAEACHRYSETTNHDMLAADFKYNSQATHNNDEREIYLFVIGETSRSDNWQLAGYERNTNPRLSKEPGLVFFKKSISESNTTHKSVPMLMSFACSENFDSIAYYKSILTAFREAGFSTAFVSNQVPNRSFTEHFGNEADTTIYTASASDAVRSLDDAIFAPVEKLIADTTRRKQLIVIHSYGSHFRYFDRYPREFAKFQPDDAIDASEKNRESLINAYDNSIVFTDYVLATLIDKLKGTQARTALLYASDHGEDIFDDERGRFLHASPVPTYWQIHQASLVWLSPTLTQENPEMAAALAKNGTRRLSPQKSLFPTAMQLAGINSPLVVDSLSVVSPNYNPAPAVYLNDLNQPLPLTNCGLTPTDLRLLHPLLR